MPIGARDAIASRIIEFNQATEEAGRGKMPITIFGAPSKPEIIEAYAESGVERVLFSLPPAPTTEILPKLEKYAGLVTQFS